MSKQDDIMFQAQRDAGGMLGVRPEEKMDYDKLWLVGARGELMAILTVPNWKEANQIAEMLAEAIEFVNRKRRRPVTEIWVNTHALDDLNLAMQVFADPELPPTEEEEDEHIVTVDPAEF